MNRETKRMMQRQGQLDESGQPATQRTASGPARRSVPEGQRRGIREYFKNVRSELRKVNWPSRSDVLNYSSVVMISLIVVISLIFGLNYIFSKAVFFLFK
ncbi:MAG: preprotein translocase subunit SecE [Acidimicrobiales bacterium]